MPDSRITGLSYSNFMSCARAEPALDDLVVLVGPNGAGKSNLVEGLRFLRDALGHGLDAAIADRGGIGRVRRKLPRGRPPDVELGVEAVVSGARCSYDAAIGARAGGGWRIGKERCRVDSGDGEWTFRRDGNRLSISGPGDSDAFRREIGGVPSESALLLAVAGGPFGALARLLTEIGAYSIRPDVLRRPQRQSAGLLADDARNLASVLGRLRRRRDPAADRIRDMLGCLVPGVTDFRVARSGGCLTVSLAVRRGERETWFDASRLSDGTLRLLGILAAIHQQPAPSLIAIEEPELTVHPGAAGVLCDELVEAAGRTQVLVTTHSPDVIARMPVESLRVVEATAGGTVIGRISGEQIAAVDDKLFSSGDLIRMEGLRREIGSAGE